MSYHPPRADGARRISLSDEPELALDKVDSPLDTGSIRARTARTGGVEAGFNPAAGRWGAVELGALFSAIDLTDAEVRGGRQSVWTAGVGWVPADPLRFVLQYQHATVEGCADDRRFQAVALRAQLKF